MDYKGLSHLEVKKLNKQSIYQYIYYAKQCSKQDILTHLNIGLTTIKYNLKLLEEEGLIVKNGFYESTGGRKAHVIEINKEARLSIGIEILKNKIMIVCVNLYGEVMHHCQINAIFISSLDYCQYVGQCLNDFIQEHHIDKEKILGVSITLQGILSQDGQHIIYSHLLNHTQLTLNDFQQFIDYPCVLEHDSKAAGYMECWHKEEYQNALVLLLNDNMGSALMLHGKIHQGNHMHGGVIEHMKMSKDGQTCYCGQVGCLETYCSAEALLQGEDVEEFFKSKKTNKRWKDYLNMLAQAIARMQTALDVPVIISGYLAQYFDQEDLEYLYREISQQYPFDYDMSYLHVSQHGKNAPTIGGTLCFIDEFIENI